MGGCELFGYRPQKFNDTKLKTDLDPEFFNFNLSDDDEISNVDHSKLVKRLTKFNIDKNNNNINPSQHKEILTNNLYNSKMKTPDFVDFKCVATQYDNSERLL